jgi:MATE family multidrug resistance protein
MPQMGQPQLVVDLAIPYFRLLVVSVFPFLIFFTFKQFLEGLGKTKVATIVIIVSNLLNIILNYLFIFGHLNFPVLGLYGAGIATLISRIVMPIILIYWFFQSKYYVKYKTYILFNKLKFSELKELFFFSLPIGLQIIIEVIAFAAGGIMMGWFGEIPLAAHQIALGIATFTFMITSGIGSATTIRISYQFGQSKFKELKMAGKASVHMALLIMSLTGLSFYFSEIYYQKYLQKILV